MLATCWTLYGIAGAIVGARIYSQLRVTRQFGVGDVIMVGSVVCDLIIFVSYGTNLSRCVGCFM